MNTGQRELVVDNATDPRPAPPPRDQSAGFLIPARPPGPAPALRRTAGAGRRTTRSVQGSVGTETQRKADRGRAALRHPEDEPRRHRSPASAEPRPEDGQELRRTRPGRARVDAPGHRPEVHRPAL